MPKHQTLNIYTRMFDVFLSWMVGKRNVNSAYCSLIDPKLEWEYTCIDNLRKMLDELLYIVSQTQLIAG